MRRWALAIALALAASVRAEAPEMDLNDPRVVSCRASVVQLYFALVEQMNVGVTPEQILDANRARMDARGYDPAVVDAFVRAVYDPAIANMRAQAVAMVRECVRVGDGG